MPSGHPGVVLASGSPRRRELLENLGVPFQVVVSGEDEDSTETDPARLAAELALLKGRSVARLHPESVVLAADTVVACEGVLLAKPADTSENEAFLRVLSGRSHQVFTGVAALHRGTEQVEVARTDVTFRPLTAAEISFYARSGEGMDKAGGYGIQALGASLVSRVEGEYTNVVGFPLSVVITLLRRAGVPVWDEVHGA
ncbi:Maf family nucleotide pyrophosphatase [Deinococcus deserti]|uniref:dTTP/UTP pyrophosphatase n=1 Tax=Deinococcus deserti (strain DSM 17065 / CIP 109153 / LMG 22923 / VCD115) TaxID=546414 RepID=C1CUW7_DEIDV|nr:Maf family nucleotide pyrophosphatase [Deinococcus deserti]ACO45984.1 putative Maf-like protein [Deinococcus deserti VCD115]